jgi:hypothetical protein
MQSKRAFWWVANLVWKAVHYFAWRATDKRRHARKKSLFWGLHSTYYFCVYCFSWHKMIYVVMGGMLQSGTMSMESLYWLHSHPPSHAHDVTVVSHLYSRRRTDLKKQFISFLLQPSCMVDRRFLFTSFKLYMLRHVNTIIRKYMKIRSSKACALIYCHVTEWL